MRPPGQIRLNGHHFIQSSYEFTYGVLQESETWARARIAYLSLEADHTFSRSDTQ